MITHIVADMNADPALISNKEYISDVIRKATEVAKLHIVSLSVKEFKDGISAVAFLEESHISIHTWPEASFASVSISVCNDNIDIAWEYIKNAFNGKVISFYKK